MSTDMKQTNPKDAIGSSKVPLDLVPDTAKIALAMAFAEGALKYGKMNFRVMGARASVYIAALDRHMTAWKNGEDVDPDSGMSHLWKAIACLAVLIDCDMAGTLVDDRPPSIDLAGRMRALDNKVAALVTQYGDRKPRHYTIEDRVPPFDLGRAIADAGPLTRPGHCQRRPDPNQRLTDVPVACLYPKCPCVWPQKDLR